jgi:hypothetical protein
MVITDAFNKYTELVPIHNKEAATLPKPSLRSGFADEHCYNRMIIGYLSAILDNEQSLSWDEWLPALMLSYNTQVHKSTLESPFFLTFLHDPCMPFFDLQQLRGLYGENHSSEAMGRLATVYTSA